MAKGLSRLSISELHAEIRRRSSGVNRLRAKRANVAAKVNQLDAEIERMGGSVIGRGSGGGGGRRPRNELNLTQALAKAMGSKTMGVAEAAAAVQRAGYRTN